MPTRLSPLLLWGPCLTLVAAVTLSVGLPAIAEPPGADPPRRPPAGAESSTAKPPTLADARRTLEDQFTRTVRPFVQQYCLDCHQRDTQEAKLDLSGDETLASLSRNERRWDLVLRRVAAGEMPPAEAPQPDPAARRAVTQWLRAWRELEIERTAADPGPVLARRLNQAEFDYTIQDLTGVDIRPAREFPVDPANEAGFSNSGESLAMSPDLLKKYLAAARVVADHLVLKPNGFDFAPHPVVTDTDRDKYCVQRIIAFYERQPTDLSSYFFAAWQHQHRERLGGPAALSDRANRSGLSAKYLQRVWETLTGERAEEGPLAELQRRWQALAVPPGDAEAGNADAETTVRRQCERLRDDVRVWRKSLVPEVKNLAVRGVSSGSQPLVLWKNRQLAANRQREGEAAADGRSAAEIAATQRFCEVFPDEFYVAERGRIFLQDRAGDRGRLLSAGFHLMVGYFRDDTPLVHLILDEAGKQELDALWQEFQFISLYPLRQYKDFIFFERAEPPRFIEGEEFDFARSEDRDATSPEKIQRLAELYLAKLHVHEASPEAIRAAKDYFTQMNAQIRWIEQARVQAEPSHLADLQRFAQRAFRRPLTEGERSELTGFYQQQRGAGLDHDDALRDTLVSILLSPHFCYRFEPPGSGPGSVPVSGYGLASRLSYFLWSSLPDEPLLADAAAGRLQQPEVLRHHVRRMLRDARVGRLAREFGGNWLDFRGFEQHNSVDRERFPEFTAELRLAMHEEPIRFLEYGFREDRSVLDLLQADYTFLNPVLAKHYGIALPAGQEGWSRVEEVHQAGRGGILPMSVFLTRNAPGLRTSPVKRGYWVVKKLLGEYIPAPPPDVPELPQDEKQLGEQTLREVLARHREHRSCSGCHARFDSIGLVFEGYGPVGERRTTDLGGRTVEDDATFPDGSQGRGVEGLRDYLLRQRRGELIDHLCRQLLAFALGRTLRLGDETTVRAMRDELAANDDRWSSLVETIVLSTPFRYQRGREYDGEALSGSP